MILDDILLKRKEQLLREKALFGADASAVLAAVKTAAQKKERPALDFAAALKKEGSVSIIAEVKKASPSKGIISQSFEPLKTAEIYEKNGASAISVLTEEHYFMGSNAYLEDIKVNVPKLRKDFIFDEFQVYHARVLGADAILLIAAMLEPMQMKELVKTAHSLSLGVLAEVHNEAEAEIAMRSGARVIGINNRDLKTFKVELDTTERLAPLIGSEFVKVSESGIQTRADIERLKRCGTDAVLIGETLMRSADAGKALRELL